MFDSQPGEHVTVNLAVPNNTPPGILPYGAGWLGNGSMTVKNGVNLISRSSTIGHELARSAW